MQAQAPNGPARSGATSGTGTAPTGHQAKTHGELADIWLKLLGSAPEEAPHFFEAGGTPLSANLLVRTLRVKLGARIGFADLVANPRFDALLAVLTARLAEPTPPEPGATAPGATEAPTVPSRPSRPTHRAPKPTPVVTRTLPLAHAQERLFFLDRVDPGNTVYNMPFAVRFEGPLSLNAFQDALQTLSDRHESLRTHFENHPTGSRQIVIAPLPVDLPVVDLTGLEPARRDAAARDLRRKAFATRFNLERGPLHRHVLVRSAAEDHLLLWTLHHIISDGWSMGVLVAELKTCYNARVQGTVARLPEPTSYGDYVAAQADDAALADAEAWWRDALHGMPLTLDLPHDLARPAQPDYAGAYVTVDLHKADPEVIRQWAVTHGLTPFMFFLGAWQLLLAHYCRQWDFAVATVTANRPGKAHAQTVGFFVNTLPLRFQGDPWDDVPTFLRKTRRHVLEALARQAVPFHRLVQQLHPEREGARAPIAQVDFSFQAGSPEAGTPFLGAASAMLPEEATMAKFELNLHVQQTEDGFHPVISYALSLWHAETVTTLADAFSHLVHDMLQRPGACLRDSRLQPPVRPAAPPAPEAPCMARAFAAAAAQHPERTALVMDGRRLSYRDLDARATRWAADLAARGLQPGDVLGVQLPRSPEYITALWAAFRAGLVLLPLAPSLPPDRRAYQLADAGARLLLALGDAGDTGPIPSLTPPDLDAAPTRAWTDQNDRALPAYLIYTSGTTGKPKGVLVGHGTLADVIWAMNRHYAMTPQDRVLQMCAPGFDISMEEICTTLTSAATLVLCDDTRINDMPAMNALMAEAGITVLNAPAAWWHAWVGTLCSSGGAPCASQRLMIVGGEATDSAVLRAWHRLAGDRITWINAYGPTETTITATWFALPAGAPLPAETARQVPIGAPVTGAETWVVHDGLRPLPAGARGELVIGGRGVALGYLGRPALTAERFVPHPFAAEPGARLYRSGDLVGLRTVDGQRCLVFGGRMDTQVKIRGYRIEIGEIEAALAAFPGVARAVVLVDGEAGDPRLAAYLQAHDGARPEMTELRDALAAKLPAYMVPTYFTRVDTFPMTPNGKLDEKALQKQRAPALEGQAYEAPAGPVEQALADVFAELLGLTGVGRHEDFFKAGGHSLLAVRLMAEIAARFDKTLPLAALFQRPTPAGLAAVLARENEADTQLQRLGPGRQGPPLVLIHPVGGNILCYLPLASGLPGREVWALRAAGLAPGEAVETDPARVIARYLDLLVEAGLDTAPHLAGWSMGGVLALHLARALTDRGTPPAAVTLIDSFAPGFALRMGGGTTNADRAWLFARELEPLTGDLGLTHAQLAEMPDDARLPAVLAAAAARDASLDTDALTRRHAVFEAGMALFEHLDDPTYAEPVTLFQADAPPPEYRAEVGWRGLLPRLRVVTLPGDHYTAVAASISGFGNAAIR